MMMVGGCRAPASRSAPGAATTLTIGLGQVVNAPNQGLAQAAKLLSHEGLVIVERDGKSSPLLARSLSLSSDGLVLRIQLRPSATFHDETAVDARAIQSFLQAQFQSPKSVLHSLAGDIRAIKANSDLEVEIDLERRSNFITEALDVSVESSASPTAGTGPFYLNAESAGEIDLSANRKYYLGAPAIARIVLKPYDSFRSAWADMLRGNLDMLYEIGVEGLDALQPSSGVRVFIHKRNYAYVIALNMRRDEFRSPEIRRAMNEALNRAQLVAEGLDNHGTPTDGPVWPDNWAYDPSLPRFAEDPSSAEAAVRRAARSRTFRFTCLVPSAQPFERLALAVQRQLRAVGIEMTLDAMSYEKLAPRVLNGDFDAVFIDAAIGPTLFREYRWWSSDGSNNYGHYKSAAVDKALDSVRRAPDDGAYRAGVVAFQKAIIADPPAIFLAWSERARAVSTRFQVPAETGRDIYSTIRLWKPVGDERHASRN